MPPSAPLRARGGRARASTPHSHGASACEARRDSAAAWARGVGAARRGHGRAGSRLGDAGLVVGRVLEAHGAGDRDERRGSRGAKHRASVHAFFLCGVLSTRLLVMSQSPRAPFVMKVALVKGTGSCSPQNTQCLCTREAHRQRCAFGLRCARKGERHGRLRSPAAAREIAERSTSGASGVQVRGARRRRSPSAAVGRTRTRRGEPLSALTRARALSASPRSAHSRAGGRTCAAARGALVRESAHASMLAAPHPRACTAKPPPRRRRSCCLLAVERRLEARPSGTSRGRRALRACACRRLTHILQHHLCD